MSDLLELSKNLGGFAHDKMFFIKSEPEISNFTKPFKGKLLIYGAKQVLTIDFFDKNNNLHIYHQLRETIFTPESTTIFWDLKSIVSYFKFHIPKVDIRSKIVDLKLIESFLDIKLPPPNSLQESLKRLKPYLENDQCKLIHNTIHKPLSLEVIPSIETFKGVIDTELKNYVYPFYIIEGQTFGRLNCQKSFDNCVTPHNMGDDAEEKLKLKSEDDFFVQFDFKHMEVSMLQWLSQDNSIATIMENYDDVYKGIYQTVFDQVCDTDAKREIIKTLFLPIMFGLQPSSLTDFSTQTAYKIHSLIREKFKTSWSYMEESQEMVKKTPLIKDHFGRPRFFEGKPWKVRGFKVQSPSATVCLEKLIDLHNSVKTIGNIIYSIHDGYILTTKQKNLNQMVLKGLQSLQSESRLCKGLKLKATCSIGVRLNKMKEVPVKKEKNGYS